MKKNTLIFIAFLIALSLLRLYLAATLGLGDDEAYYWEWSRHLAISYYDQPPMVAYLIWLFTSWGGDTELMVRLGNLLLSLAATVVTYLWAREVFEQEEAGLWSVLLLSLVPIFNVGSLISLPDGALGAFWIITLFLVHRALRTRKDFYWYLAGLSWGLALLSKYNGILLGLVVLGYLLIAKEDRFWLKRPQPYLATGIAFLVFLPVLIWNYQHGFASFLFHLTHKGSKSSPFQSFLLFLLPPFGYLSPLVYLGAWWALWWALKEGWRRRLPQLLFLAVASLVPLIFFAVISVKGKFKPYYPALGFQPAIIAFAGIYAISQGSKFRRRFFLAAFILCCLFSGAMLVSTKWPLTSKGILAVKELSSTLPFEGLKQKGAKLTVRADETNDLYGWPEAALQTREMYAWLSQEGPAFIFGERYHIASHLAFYMGRQTKVYCITLSRDQYKYFAPPAQNHGKERDGGSFSQSSAHLERGAWGDKIRRYISRKKWEVMVNYLEEISRLKGQNAIFVCDSRYLVNPEERYLFDKITLEKVLVIKRGDVKVRTFYFYKGYNFQGLRGLGG